MPDDEEPEPIIQEPTFADPVSPTLQGCIAVYELFQGYVDAGFTRDEALKIVISIITK